MNKKTLAKKPTPRNRAADRQRLARELSSILKNPETPIEMFNAIHGEIVGWSEAFCNEQQNEVDYIHNCLESYERAESERKGGAK